MSFIRLDWSKAFDKVTPAGMLSALEEFGLPDEYVRMVAAIYQSRTFNVRDNGAISSSRAQTTGIAQGCPLSPYLSIIVLTAIFNRVDQSLLNSPDEFLHYFTTGVFDITYADDTLLVSSSASRAELYLKMLLDAARPFGLEPTWGKTLHLRIGHDDDIHTPQGSTIKVVEQAIYLGSLLTTNGYATASLVRRLGEAIGVFNRLIAVWKHANLTTPQKLRIFDACVVSKLLYALECEWLLAGNRKKLDGFYITCLRSIQRIPHPMISHVSNAEVLLQAGRQPLTKSLQSRQLLLFGRIALLPQASPVRRVCFAPGTVTPRQFSGGRKRGRARTTWTQSTYALALQACGHDACVLQAALCHDDSQFGHWQSIIND